MEHLPVSKQWALGFMVFALFLGAGNIIFPPSAGLAAGKMVVWAAFGFLVTAVGLPLVTLIAVAKAGGGLSRLTTPLGHTAGFIMAITVYLAIGPLFATPRTAVVSFEMALAPIVGEGALVRTLYLLAYFSLVLYLSLQRGRLAGYIGQLITPILLLGLAILGVTAWIAPVGPVAATVSASYQEAPFLRGVIEGYLTMDMLGALVFGVVLSTAIHEYGIREPHQVMRYSIQAALIAALGLAAVYLSFFYLGATSSTLVVSGSNGAQILAAYAQQALGSYGQILLAVVVILACLTTAVGLVVACSEFFSQRLALSYGWMVVVFTFFSAIIANRGLSQLLRVSLPVLVGLYPLAIALVLLNLLKPYWKYPTRVFKPVMGITLIFGVMDGLNTAGWTQGTAVLLPYLPLSAQGLGWLLPMLGTLLVVAIWDRCQPSASVTPL